MAEFGPTSAVQRMEAAALTFFLRGKLPWVALGLATLLFAGNPARFPFKHNDGMFQVWVPLRQATYALE